MPRKEREKGKRGERWAVNEFKKHGFDAIRRGWHQCYASPSDDGADPPDVSAPPFVCEVKNQKKANIRAALKQAQKSAGPGDIPIAVVRDTDKPATVTMLFSDFLDFAQEWRERGE